MIDLTKFTNEELERIEKLVEKEIESNKDFSTNYPSLSKLADNYKQDNRELTILLAKIINYFNEHKRPSEESVGERIIRTKLDKTNK